MASFKIGESALRAYCGRVTSLAARSASLVSWQAHTCTRHRGVRTSGVRTYHFERLKVNQERMMRTLHETCEFGTGKRWGAKATETGMSRLALSDADQQARDWFVKTTKRLGCSVTVDAIGNIFAVRPGRNGGSAATFAGSHLDTQPSGGRYDGILGIHAGIEMLEILAEHDVETEHPVGVVNWTNEEGARFPISMVASGVWAEEIPIERAHGLQEVGGGKATMRSELERIGYMGSTPASYRSAPIAAHFELHIEQGPILETEGQKIGVVQGVQAYRWFTIDVDGRDAHTGTTPFSSRADALLLAARLITHSHKRAVELDALASTGILSLTPGSVNTIPGHVRFSLDIRAPADHTLDTLEATLRRDFNDIARGQNPRGSPLETSSGSRAPSSASREPLSVSWTTDSVSPATLFHEDCIAAVRASAESVLGGPERVRDMVSGAGHDSVYASRRCPTSMIFVPCRNGVSHNPEEWTSDEDCALGAEVLCHSVLKYDQLRAGRGG